ncbi:hypothetical protein BaRGS_00004353 [Batillaria attramentaria]|uniref:Transcriptional adapter 1 n=1 Tax=Batillaria attramentaria TaxID=370345 RepID=A0ABD0LYG8_9CAEN
MAASMDLNAARQCLTEELGESSTVYFQNLASWFKKKTSKEDFDLEARRLLKSDAVHLHNEFLLAIIAKCQSISSSMVLSKEAALQSAATTPSKLQKGGKLKRKQSTGQISMQQRFIPANPLDYAPKISSKPVEEGTSSLGFTSRDLLLPDLALIHGRALVCAWEMGLQDVQDNVVKLIIHALELQLKRILSAVMEKRSGEATTITNSGYHTPSLKPSVDVAEQAAAHELASATGAPHHGGPITLFDLLETFQLNRSVIPSQTVYAPAVERVINKMWHPHPDEEASDAHQHQDVHFRQIPPSVYTSLIR